MSDIKISATHFEKVWASFTWLRDKKFNSVQPWNKILMNDAIIPITRFEPYKLREFAGRNKTTGDGCEIRETAGKNRSVKRYSHGTPVKPALNTSSLNCVKQYEVPPARCR